MRIAEDLEKSDRQSLHSLQRRILLVLFITLETVQKAVCKLQRSFHTASVYGGPQKNRNCSCKFSKVEFSSR